MPSDPDLHTDHLFSRQFLWLKAASALYVLGLLFAHSSLSEKYVWEIAIFFSVAMNFTYPWAAWRTGQFLTFEVMIAAGLILLSLLSLVSSPLFVIAAIFLHGTWDVAKHRGQGVRFFSWYTLGCVTVDWLYSGALLLYYLG